MKLIPTFFALLALLFAQAKPLTAQIPADELPSAGTDTGLEGKYDPENGIAQLIRDDIGFFQAVKAALAKPRGPRKTTEDHDHAARQLVGKAIAREGKMIDVFQAAASALTCITRS